MKAGRGREAPAFDHCSKSSRAEKAKSGSDAHAEHKGHQALSRPAEGVAIQ
jgi:hypothetical protein